MTTETIDGAIPPSFSIYDEAGMMPLKFGMGGCKFRWDVFKMAYEMSHPKSFERIIKTSQDIIDWVNNEQKLPQQIEKQCQ